MQSLKAFLVERAGLLVGPERAHVWAAAPRRLVRTLRGKLRASRAPATPELVNWDLTYACPLRCEHCYSESGRRPSRQLGRDDLFRIADVLLALHPIPEVVFTGGEPLLVREMHELAAHLRRGGARLAIYTSGYALRAGGAASIAREFDRVAVSIDGDDPAINDVIRGRAGAFDVALSALAQLDVAVAAERARHGRRVRLGIECSVVRSNLRHLDGLCRDVARRYAALSFVHFGAAIPTGLASEERYAERELLTPHELAELRAAGPRLQRLAPATVMVRVYDNAGFMMAEEQAARGVANDHLVKIEADGRMRAMDIYEGVVGNVLDEPFDVLWTRACARADDPFVKQQLARVRSMQEWAAATRRIDRRFASEEDLLRLDARR